MAVEDKDKTLDILNEPIDSIEKAQQWLEYRRANSALILSSMQRHREARALAEKSKDEKTADAANTVVQSLKQQLKFFHARDAKVQAFLLVAKENEENILRNLPDENNLQQEEMEAPRPSQQLCHK